MNMSHYMSFAVLCPMYHDANTSNVIFTHAMDKFMIFTRYDTCIPSIIDGNAEGGWRVASGRYINNTEGVVKADFGFHEFGKVRVNQIEWSNGAKWNVPISTRYRGMDENAVFSITRADSDKLHVFDRTDNQSLGTMRQICQDVFLPPRRGVIKGTMIAWNDGNIWWEEPNDDDEQEEGDGEAYEYDEWGFVDNSSHKESAVQDISTYDDWWSGLVSKRQMRKKKM